MGHFEGAYRGLFKTIGGEATGYVSCDEIVKCLSLLGYPVTPEMIAVEFREFDFDKDNKMDFREFSKFMNYKMRTTVFRIDHMLHEIRLQFQKVHPTDGQNFEFAQFSKALETINKEITIAEQEALFYEVDQDQSGFVNIEEVMKCLKRAPDDTESPLVTNCIIKLQLTHVISIKDLETIFHHLPKHFCISFTRQNFLQMKNLPSDSLFPKLMPSTLGYHDLYGEYLDQKSGVVFPVKPLSAQFTRLISLDLATGIPIPTPTKETSALINDHIKSREVRVLMFDRETHRFVGGTQSFPATWNPEYEDRWWFEQPGVDYSFYVRAPSLKSSLYLIFEFVLVVERDKTTLQISSGWCSVDLDNISKSGSLELPLFGGAPSATFQIKTTDVKTGRSTLMGKIGKFFSGDIKSQLVLKVTMPDKIKPQTLQMLDFLPRTILVPVESLWLWRAYRFYVGRAVVQGSGKVNTSLNSDIIVKTFLRCVNLSSFHRKLAQIWNANAEPKFVPKGKNQLDFSLISSVFEEAMEITHPMFDSFDFRFNKTDQTREYYIEPTSKNREAIVVSSLQRIREILQFGNVTSAVNDIKCNRPFSVDETFEDDFNDISGAT